MILYAGNVNPCYIFIERQVKTDGRHDVRRNYSPVKDLEGLL